MALLLTKKLGLLAILATTLAACANLNSKFNCETTNDASCQSIGEVNEQVNLGTLAGPPETGPILAKSRILPPAKVSESNYLTDTPGIRLTEKVLKVWITPYTDEHDNFHGGGLIYTVVKPGYWDY